MIRYLIQRPVAVLMCFLALTIAGLALIGKIPVSLLPDIDVPKIVINVNYPDNSAAVLEQNIIRPIREHCFNLANLKDVESLAANHTGTIYLTFSYGARMDLAYIEVNEKLDRLVNSLPRDMQRPQVMRINTSDIPVIRIQVIPGPGSNFAEVSALTEKTLKRRIEQLEGVSLVDINGRQRSVIDVVPDKAALTALGVDNSIIVQAIQTANQELGNLSVKDGQYRYAVKLVNNFGAVEKMNNLPVKLPDGSIIPLKRIAALNPAMERPTGYHLLNGQEGLVITVQKQPDSKMNELVPRVKEIVTQFKKDYPAIQFSTTQDQTFLLDAGISNLYQDICIGGILTILLLFMFLGNWASPSLMSISIPLSLVFTFIFFYLFGLSFNIISLSGLALGIGMLIDNSIVVIDNITRKRSTGLNMLESSVQGTNEVTAPVISQVLTTVAVYAPLVLLNGMASPLVADQSIALTISLGVSLLVAFILSPLLYRLLLKRPPERLKEDTLFYRWIAARYHQMIGHILQHKLRYFLVTLLVMPAGLFIATRIPVSALPRMEKKESLLLIDWNAPIDAQENLRRVKQLQLALKNDCQVVEAEVGIQQFLLQQENNNIQNAAMYYACSSEKQKQQVDKRLLGLLQRNYPGAAMRLIDAPNAFTQLFTDNSPHLEARFRPATGVGNPENAYSNFSQVTQAITQPYQQGAGLATQKQVDILLDEEKMALYSVGRAAIENTLQQLYGNYTVSEIKRFGDIKTIRLHIREGQEEDKLNTMVASSNGQQYPLRLFLTMQYAEQPEFITADRAGIYRSLLFTKAVKEEDVLMRQLSQLATSHHFDVTFAGRYFEDRAQVGQLWRIFFIVLFLLYVILAIQYEDLVLPLIVMLTIPLGVAGGMCLLWITGGTLDVMAGVGFIVILGLIVDDPTLKVEVLRRLEKEYAAKGYKKDDALLERMIHEAGHICLKPLLMVSLTTSIAMLPVLFIGGMGNDLQKPLAYVIIGGLTIGTFFTTWFIPLAYWYVSKWRDRSYQAPV